MSIIGSIVAIVCAANGNIGGAIIAFAVGVMVDAIVIDIIGLLAILATIKEVKNNGK